MKDNEYYHLVKELADVKDLLAEVLRRLGKLEYSGFIEYGNKYSATNSEKIVKVTLSRDVKDDE